MKLSFTFSLLALLIPLAVQAAVVPEHELAARHNHRGRGGFGGFGGNNGSNKQGQQGQQNQTGGQTGNKNGSGNSSAASSTTSSAAAATSSVAATGQPIVGGGNSKDAQSSLQLDPGVVMKGLEQDGQETPEAGQVPSLTSSNNFINFCLTQPNLPLTNGQQVTTGSCNQTPMGVIVATTKMPSSKFVSPKNGDTIAANQAFTVSMAINNLETGNFVNAAANYYAAPAQVNSDGTLIGHSHIVIEQLQSLDQTTPTDPQKFAFFKGLNAAAQNGILTADVTAGLPAGVYRAASINTASNHQPALVAVAQHGSLDDQIYFTVSDNGAASNSTNTGSAASTSAAAAASNTSTASTSAAAAAASSTSTAGKGQGQNQNQQGNNGQNQGKNQQNQQTGRNGRGNNGRGRRDRLARLS